MQTNNAAMHMECTCIALVMRLHHTSDFQCFPKSDFQPFGAVYPRVMHLQCIWNASALHLHLKKNLPRMFVILNIIVIFALCYNETQMQQYKQTISQQWYKH